MNNGARQKNGAELDFVSQGLLEGMEHEQRRARTVRYELHPSSSAPYECSKIPGTV